jgi:hypothetical protein
LKNQAAGFKLSTDKNRKPGTVTDFRWKMTIRGNCPRFYQ